MKLAAKLILIFLAGVLAIVSLFAWQTIRRQQTWEEQRRQAHADQLVQTLKPAIMEAYQKGGTVTIQRAIEVSTETLNGPRLRWVQGQTIQRHKGRPSIESKESTCVLITDDQGNRMAYSKIPISLGGQESGLVEVVEPVSEQDAFMWDSMKLSLGSLLGVAGLSAIVIYVGGVRLVGRPLERLTAQVHSIGEGHLDQSPVLSGADELGDLARAISDMSSRLRDQQDAIRHADRLGTVGTLAAGMAHEMGTPLNVVSGRANLIGSGKLSADEVSKSAATIKSEADRMTKIIRQLLDFARQSPSQHRVFALSDVARKTSELMQPLAKKASVEIQFDPPVEPVSVAGDESQIQQVLTNLISNAIAAIQSSGLISISVEQLTDTDEVRLNVRDNGTGITAEVLPHLFEPFYTTKDVGEGTGLGLSIAYGIVKDHGGNILVESEPGIGSMFSILLPLAERSDREV